MKIIEKNISEIRPYEKNPRINDNAVDKVAQSLSAYGWKQPLVIDKDGVIIVGHTRFKAAQKLGMETVPCLVADDLTDDQVRAYRLADNKVSDYSIWDNKLLLEELDEIPDDLFTGFELGGIFDDTLNENDNTPVEDNKKGVTYEVVFRTEDRKKVEKLQAMWEGIQRE